MDDEVIQIEVALSFVNTLLTKAIFFKDAKATNDLHAIRHDIYYEDDFDYAMYIKKLQTVDLYLKKYE